VVVDGVVVEAEEEAEVAVEDVAEVEDEAVTRYRDYFLHSALTTTAARMIHHIITTTVSRLRFVDEDEVAEDGEDEDVEDHKVIPVFSLCVFCPLCSHAMTLLILKAVLHQRMQCLTCVDMHIDMRFYRWCVLVLSKWRLFARRFVSFQTH
jgi:hypothetical protein